MPNISQPPEQQQNQPSAPKKPEREGWRSIASTIGLLIAAPLIALFLTAFVFQSYEVDGPSMETTLQNRDRLIVIKTGKTWSRVTHKTFVPKRGDIVVFNKRGLYEFGQANDKQLIKRVVGLPGERVVVHDGKVTVYNNQFPGGLEPDALGGYGSAITTTPGNTDITVPAGQVFVCGDNRTNSLDSRSFGPIETKDIVGTLSLRIFPLNKLDSY